MTPEQLVAVKVGDTVSLRGLRGRVAQTTAKWFMVAWDGGHAEIVDRRSSILTSRLELGEPHGWTD